MYLLDTNICIYIIRRRPAEVLRILKTKLNKDIFVSSITVAELEYGAAKSMYPQKNRIALFEFLSIFNILDFTAGDAAVFGEIKAGLEKSGRIIGPMDLLIAAQAKAGSMVLVSSNTGEFERVDGLKVENWAGGR